MMDGGQKDNSKEIERRYISIDEAAQRLGYTKGAVCLLCREGKLLDVYKEGREWRISLTELEQYKPLPKGFAGATIAKRRRNAVWQSLKHYTDVEIACAVKTLYALFNKAKMTLDSNEAKVDERMLAFYGMLRILNELDALADRFSNIVKRRYPALKRTSFRTLMDTVLISRSIELLLKPDRMPETMQMLLRQTPVVKRLRLLERIAELLAFKK